MHVLHAEHVLVNVQLIAFLKATSMSLMVLNALIAALVKKFAQ
jgi:hypothetical protein